MTFTPARTLILPAPMAKSDQLRSLARIVREHRWAALATVDQNCRPFASMVACIAEPRFRGFLLHLSRLAAHTVNLLANPQASLVFTEVDDGGGNPQELARVSVQGRVELIPRDGEDYPGAREWYLARLPDAEPLFDFPDFVLFRLRPDEARFVGGFAQARTFRPEELEQAPQDPPALPQGPA